jgi:hypothetical protein
MKASDVMDTARAMAVADVDGLDPEDKFKLSLKEKFAVHEAMDRHVITGAHDEFFMAVAKSRRRLVVYVENGGERILVDVEKLYDTAREMGSLDAAFQAAFTFQRADHVVQGPFACNFAFAHWVEGPMD